MAWKEPWRLKIRRRLRKPFNKVFHRRHYFIARYHGADFLLQPTGIGTLEISAKIAEHPELTNFMRCCAHLRPEIFLDIGANIGLYSCILLKNGCVPRAILFEPDRLNLIQLRANLLINNVLALAEIHDVALGDVAGTSRLVPGKIDGGFSQIIADAHLDDGSYEVKIVRVDDALSLSNRTLLIKIDVEHYECHVLAGMTRTLRENRCLVQIEAFENRDQVVAMMAEIGYEVVGRFAPNFVFDKPNA
jgi:FkbM family methyltransferase